VYEPPRFADSSQLSRSDALVNGLGSLGALAGLTMLPQLVGAAEEAATVGEDLGPAPADFSLSKEYYKDAGKMLQHMK
jgi:hypothetical protein